jgi:hypothetical protein
VLLWLYCTIRFTFLTKCINPQYGSGVHPASYPMGTGCSFPGDKAAGAWSWPLTSTSCRDQECVGTYLHSQHVFMAWCLVKHRDNFMLPSGSSPVWWPGNKNSPTVTHACLKRRLKWVATLPLGYINTEAWSSGMGVGRETNNPTL